jgi:hypothetical protein
MGFQAQHQPAWLIFACARCVSIGDAICKKVMNGHAMHKISKKKSPIELADLILKHNPSAYMERIAGVICEWGDVFDDHQHGRRESVDIERSSPYGQATSVSYSNSRCH